MFLLDKSKGVLRGGDGGGGIGCKKGGIGGCKSIVTGSN